MDLEESRILAESLMALYELNEWSFKFNKNKRRLGVCKQDEKRIELSEHYVTHNDREHVVDTILHEIAHALVGTEHGHDDVWKAMCLRVGASPFSCSNTAIMPDGYWQAKCPGCHTVFSRHRRPRRLRGRYCVACGPERGQLVFSDVRNPRTQRPIRVVRNVPPSQPAAVLNPVQLTLKLLFG